MPLVAGILCQWYFPVSFSFLCTAIVLLAVFVILFSFLPTAIKAQYTYFNGIFFQVLLLLFGALLVWGNLVTNNKRWVGCYDGKHTMFKVTLQESLTEKEASYKSVATVDAVISNKKAAYSKGNIIIYFKKADGVPSLTVGDEIVFKRPLAKIKNSGNPGSFDYKQYNLFKGITHQVYLTSADYDILPFHQQTVLKKFIVNSRDAIVAILQKYIQGKKEQGLAEALLIGYKVDLDKELLKSYTNTGVVHLIAISGLHLGIIYGLLLALTASLKGRQRFALLRFIIIGAGLWMFSLMAGAQPSVLRSAVMFTCIAFGVVVTRKTSIYNTLALSAFLLLCYNPFWLWDVGFQLSYAAVLSIVLFFRPIYNSVYLPNVSLDFLWKLISVTLAAQILTTPISLYHFHQFPLLFLLTNMVAVPLSSIILMGGLLLVFFSFLPPVAFFIATFLKAFISFLNFYIERLGHVSFAVWDGVSISVFQTVMLTVVLVGVVCWCIQKNKLWLQVALVSLLLFALLQSYYIIEATQQQKLIVYNIPHHQAMDVIDGRRVSFIGDDNLIQNESLAGFHLQPSRNFYRVKETGPNLQKEKSFVFNSKRIWLIDENINFSFIGNKPKADVMVLSKNPKLYISDLQSAFAIRQVVIDASVPRWKAALWKRDCITFGLPYYDVAEKGAFVMTVE